MARFAVAAMILVAGLLGAPGQVLAHPHVWVTAKSELAFAPDGRITAVRHRWTFDEMFTAFATQGLDTDRDGRLSREELQSLAQVNVESLEEFEFFTFARPRGNRRLAFDKPTDYFLVHENNALTLHFTLPLREPVRTGGPLEFEVYDPTFFVSFEFAQGDAVRLAGAPAGCGVEIRPPRQAAPAQSLSEAFFSRLTPTSDWGRQFASTAMVSCR